MEMTLDKFLSIYGIAAARLVTSQQIWIGTELYIVSSYDDAGNIYVLCINASPGFKLLQKRLDGTSLSDFKIHTPILTTNVVQQMRSVLNIQNFDSLLKKYNIDQFEPITEENFQKLWQHAMNELQKRLPSTFNGLHFKVVIETV